MWIVVKYSPIFKTARVAEKDLKNNKDNSLHLGQKYARIFVLGHNLFLVAHSFPRASLSENCSLLGTDNVRGQISEHIFAPNSDYFGLYGRQMSNILSKKLFTFLIYFFSLVPLEKFGNIRFLTFFESGSLGTTAIWLSSTSAPINVPISLASSLGLSWLVIATPVISRQSLLRYCWVSSSEQSIRHSLESCQQCPPYLLVSLRRTSNFFTFLIKLIYLFFDFLRRLLNGIIFVW